MWSHIWKKTSVGVSVTCTIYVFVAVTYLNSCNRDENIKGNDVHNMTWSQIENTAQGQAIHFSAWAGSDQINRYIQWVADELSSKYKISLHHMPNNGGVEAIQVVQKEKTINKKKRGSIDLVWINGAAFRLGKEEGLLTKNIYDLVPNTQYLSSNRVLFEDFTIPTEGDEVPWGTAQLIFFLRADKIDESSVPSYDDFFRLIKKHKGRFTYPQVPDFTGLTFVKNLFYVFSDIADRDLYYSLYNEEKHREILEKNTVWKKLQDINPYLWSQGMRFPRLYSDLERMYKDGEVYFGMTFNPYTPLSNVTQGTYPKKTQTFLPQEGSIANAHFLAIPYNSPAKAAALVAINFLLSPEAQARKSDITYWGDPTVIDTEKLSLEQKDLFKNNTPTANTDIASPPSNVGKHVIREFHASWEKVIEKKWKKLFL